MPDEGRVDERVDAADPIEFGGLEAHALRSELLVEHCRWRLAGARGARQITFVFSKRGEPRYHFVSFSDLVFDPVISRGCVPKQLERLLQACASRCQRKRRRIVIDVILSNQLVYDLYIAFVDFFIKAAD